MLVKGNILSGLATFEVAAKLGSFTQAANYLHLSTGAISQQINLLESQLSMKLFDRHSRGITLTEAGSQIFQVIKCSFNDIKEVIERLQNTNKFLGEIRLKLNPSLAYKWLVPRLNNFAKLYPDIRIHTFADLFEEKYNDFDVAIDYGQSPYELPQGELILAEKLIPVMSPDYYQQFNWQDHRPENQRKIWQSITLLHDSIPFPMQPEPSYSEWRYWFNKQGIKLDTDQGYFFNRTDMATAAAEAGLGIAMGRHALVAEDIKQKRLIAPFPSVKANAGYYFIQNETTPAIQCFKKWITRECNA